MNQSEVKHYVSSNPWWFFFGFGLFYTIIGIHGLVDKPHHIIGFVLFRFGISILMFYVAYRKWQRNRQDASVSMRIVFIEPLAAIFIALGLIVFALKPDDDSFFRFINFILATNVVYAEVSEWWKNRTSPDQQ